MKVIKPRNLFERLPNYEQVLYDGKLCSYTKIHGDRFSLTVLGTNVSMFFDMNDFQIEEDDE